ncbi:TPA: hypothetical protein ACJCXE_004425 [Yersinia enterocolitica]|uniref:hypothetical protein n=1 Tax=Yersinia enterocolitica TaxID=630 RepID=UPI002893BFCC|nr:hypothetical protein [Yersinia enterocolitica]HDL7743626.1 hypothetical protein [Yersinia enterocolitica]HDL8250213.1 hypothetical protein [Yersinia enterocolitica]HDM8283974.1 hypothetical protein [Yersinia enterocolitica]HDY4940748.1 hypothetical protein [Yersinia enterocolitica]
MLSKEQLEKIANPGAADIGGTQSPIVTQMAIELLESRAESLSLREQLAELKALPPAAYLIHEKGGARQLRFLGLNAVSQADIEEHELWQEPLFTAAKPAEDKC